jgi:hypothetical protein
MSGSTPSTWVISPVTRGVLVSSHAYSQVMSKTPDFARLFARPENYDDVEYADPWLEPRLALLLWEALSEIAFDLKLDLKGFDKTQDPFLDGLLLSSLPRFTWKQNKEWVRGLAQSAKGLRSDLKKGRLPRPRNVAEEVILHLAIDVMVGYLGADELIASHEELNALPDLEEPFDKWDLYDLLFQDLDVLLLFEPEMDGFEGDRKMAKELGLADYRADAWFKWFGNMKPRRAG